jgi:hypothetical protein
VVGARDGDLAGFQRLAQRIEHLRGELRNYVVDSVRNFIARVHTT